MAKLFHYDQFCQDLAEIDETSGSPNWDVGAIQEFTDFEKNVESQSTNVTTSSAEVDQKSNAFQWSEMEAG